MVDIWTDGSCDNKRKDLGGGIGIVVVFGEKELHISKGTFYDQVSAARMEVLAVVSAIELVKPGYDYTIYSDNQYCVKTLNEGWLWKWLSQGIIEDKAHSDLWKRFEKKYKQLDQRVEMKWIPGHAKGKYPYNERADELANQGRKGIEIRTEIWNGRNIN